MSRTAILLYLLALFAVNVYRAATQSFTTDEAYSYRIYISAQPFSVFRQFDANLHLLHTLGVWLSVKLFGMSELAFRLPSLAGCAIYFAAVYRIARRVTWVAALLLTSNPLIQDHMSAARAYGLALGLFAWAFYEAMAADPRYTRIAALLSLTLAANLTFFFPAAALVLVLMWRNGSLMIDALLGPSAVFTSLLLVFPLSRMRRDAFYFGAETVQRAAQSLLELSIGNRHVDQWAALGISALLVLAALVIAWRERITPSSFRFLAAATFSLTAGIVLLSHFVGGIALPFARTGIYLLFLAPLFLVSLARTKWPSLAFAALAVFQLAQIRPGVYQEWEFDAASRRIIAEIERSRTNDAPVSISTSPPLSFSLELYRDLKGLSWLRVETAQWRPGFDYYLLRSGDHVQIERLGLHEIAWGEGELKVARP